MEILYSENAANALTSSEKTDKWREIAYDLKANLIINNKANAKSLIDLGCGWGSVSMRIADAFDVVLAVDESQERLNEIIATNSNLKTLKASINSLPCKDNEFDICLLCHVFHEILLFSEAKEIESSIKEILRVLKGDDGRIFIIDHCDPGDGLVSISVESNIMQKFQIFVEKFKIRPITKYSIENNVITLNRRDCHDFVTKIWSLDTGAEELEMDETHCVMDHNLLSSTLQKYGLMSNNSMTFNPISDLMEFYDIRLVEGEDWNRQLFSSFSRVGNVQ